MKFALVFICFISLTISCRRIEVSKDTPKCIKKEIRQILQANPTSPRSEVWQYDYKGKTVYYLPSPCCDIPSKLYDSKCDLICGAEICADFFAERTNEFLVWRDER